MDVKEASDGGASRAAELLSLLDWKRRVFELYRLVREAPSPADAREQWRRGRDELFHSHPRSPLAAGGRTAFGGLEYFPYDAEARVLAAVEPVPSERVAIGASAGAPVWFERIGRARFALGGDEQTLDLFWLEGYGGGLFVPLADGTSGAETYGAGRYLLDTVKGADLGWERGRLVLDLNFAYNPSCAYDPRWACPLAPPANRLAPPVRAGERAYQGAD